MARPNNKHTSINYRHILQKDPSSSSTSSPVSYSSVTRSNGRMLVLTKPSPKPLKSSVTTPPPKTPDQPISEADPNQISLRPLGHTGPGSSLSFPARTSGPEKNVAPPAPLSVSLKPDRFVPPHLRQGFVRKDEKTGLASSSILGLPPQEQQQPRQGYSGYGHTGRPKSGGYIRSDPEYLGRPRSTGNRPGTSG